MWFLLLRSSWTWVAVGFVAVSGYAALQHLALKFCRAEFAQFRADTESLEAAAKVAAARKEFADLEKRAQADAENTRTLADLRNTIAKLRNNLNASRSRLPEAPASSPRPDLACFDRSEYQREDGIAVEKLFAGARELADEGTTATVNLNTAKRWAQSSDAR